MTRRAALRNPNGPRAPGRPPAPAPGGEPGLPAARPLAAAGVPRTAEQPVPRPKAGASAEHAALTPARPGVPAAPAPIDELFSARDLAAAFLAGEPGESR